ncbi:hypothetical protein WT09_11410 [Burkholderia stagnalis]|nr:hypothetical protein WT09_11410 [Burkholderia stagnalis]
MPNLVVWSLDQADVTELTGQARTDYERELRISAIGKLLESPAATPLWRKSTTGPSVRRAIAGPAARLRRSSPAR